jgi:hypothetical protein
MLRAVALTLASLGAETSMAQSSEFIDSAASFLALFIIFALPIGGIALFWIVHVLPEKVAEKRHHPQKDAIKVLCFLSLVFGGMLWPIAWLWAYSKPVLYKLAYGRDRHDEYYEESGETALTGGGAAATAKSPTVALRAELAGLRRKLEELEARGELPSTLAGIPDRLSVLEAQTSTASKSVVGAD